MICRFLRGLGFLGAAVFATVLIGSGRTLPA
jgi:hypothetical protein